MGDGVQDRKGGRGVTWDVLDQKSGKDEERERRQKGRTGVRNESLRDREGQRIPTSPFLTVFLVPFGVSRLVVGGGGRTERDEVSE